ncbi:hypothetical protein GPECTOR_2g1290 [Gonium pectorale]|uniref:Protein kinase domain-containing protein n=1 Tax=Gonium pectorale TaxID=33097 RepID=A0A150H2D3_GONPE|nr:hypothetical protein GPECTOR_2g1290 [Gonium pectorale]|eukprot:KXZ55740.1 hypothetical protein GPECTOR_2g1290 [Gonium pectorale]
MCVDQRADFYVRVRALPYLLAVEYMAPEVERCPLKMLPEENKDQQALAYTTAVDIWATGVLAYELLLGFPPFLDEQSGVALSFPSSMSPGARDFISLALAERPEDRPTAPHLSRHPWITILSRSAVGSTSPAVSTRQVNSTAEE